MGTADSYYVLSIKAWKFCWAGLLRDHIKTCNGVSMLVMMHLARRRSCVKTGQQVYIRLWVTRMCLYNGSEGHERSKCNWRSGTVNGSWHRRFDWGNQTYLMTKHGVCRTHTAQRKYSVWVCETVCVCGGVGDWWVGLCVMEKGRITGWVILSPK